jgi:hypothetical protein
VGGRPDDKVLGLGKAELVTVNLQTLSAGRLPFSDVRLTIEPGAAGVIDVRDYGADDTGTSDSTDAINDAVNAAKDDGKMLIGYGGTFRVDGTVNLKTSCDFAASTFTSAAGNGVPMVRIADDDLYLKRLRGLWIRLPRLVQDESNVRVFGNLAWPTTDEGVRIEGLSRSYVMFDYITFFQTGIRILSSTETVTGTDFNTFQLSEVNGCKTNVWLDVRARDSHPTDEFGGGGTDGGWVNENTFIGGALRHESLPEEDVTDCVQLKLSGFANSQEKRGYPGRNVFYRTSLEGNTHQYALWCEGESCQFVENRYERFDTGSGRPPERIMLNRTAIPGTDIPTAGCNGNTFSGRAIERLTDPDDDYGSFMFGDDMTSTSVNWAWDVDHIGRSDDEGGGWVKVVDGSGS